MTRNWTQQQVNEANIRMYGKTKSAPIPSDATDDESQLQHAIIAECHRRGYFTVRSRMDRPTTNQIGVPDIIIAANDGRVIWCECKSRTGKLRPEQLAAKVWLEKLGHEYLLCRSMAEFLELVK